MITQLSFTAPVKLISEANNRDNWVKKRKRKVAQQQEILAELHNALKNEKFELPVIITLKRIGPKLLDSDNLANAFKATQDQIAAKLGIDDGDISKVTWLYEQEAIGKRKYAVEVKICTKK